MTNKKYNFRAIFQAQGSYIVCGEIMAKNKEEATLKVIDEDFDSDDWDGECEGTLSLAKHNGDLLLKTLEKIKTLKDINLIHSLIDSTLDNLKPVVEDIDIYEN